MRSITINERHDSRRLERVLRDLFPNMPPSAMYKAFRKRDIKVNGVRVKEDHVVAAGDKIDVFIVDDILDGAGQTEDFKLNKGFTVVYEDNNILIANKAQGIPVHPDRDQSENTLIDLVQEYLREKGEYNPNKPGSFPPSLCHRLDRNTGGLVLIAKNNEALKTLLDMIKNREIRKYYQCLVSGRMEKPSAELRAYLEKDERKSRVFVSDTRKPGALEIITRYRVLSYEDDVSRLEVELITGRTHQIRAHLAYIGHPIIGDGKYGLNSINRSMGMKQQALWACKIVFDFKNGGILSYLKGKKFEVESEFNLKSR